MITKKNKYILMLGPDTPVDLGELTKTDWKQIKEIAKQITIAGESKDPCSAYVAAFITYLNDISLLAEPFDPDYHKMN